MSRHKPCFDTLEDCNATTDLLLCDQLLDDELESSEWLLLVGNPVDDLRDIVKTITAAEAIVKKNNCDRSSGATQPTRQFWPIACPPLLLS